MKNPRGWFDSNSDRQTLSNVQRPMSKVNARHPDVGPWTLYIGHSVLARVAQLIERWSYKPEVEGLSPSSGTKTKDEGGGMKDERKTTTRFDHFIPHPSSLIPCRGPVVQRNQSVCLLNRRSQVQILPGSPFFCGVAQAGKSVRLINERVRVRIPPPRPILRGYDLAA